MCSDLEQDGYDSDASVDPYAEVADEGPLEVDEPPLQEVGNGDILLGVVQEDTESGHFIDIPPAKLAQMKVSELKYELSRHGQRVGGRKVVLLERLKLALFQQIAIQSTNNNPQQTMDNLNGFSPNARILQMFDQFEMKFHNCWFDNLYISVKFDRAAYVHEQKIQISGPT